MKKHIKIFYIFSIVIFFFMCIITYDEYKKIDKIKHLVALEESSAIAMFIKSFRKVYLNSFVNHDIEINEKTIDLLPAKSLPVIAQEFEKLIDGVVTIRTVSDRPRNPNNKANLFENRGIKYFNKNKNAKSYVLHEKENSHSYFVPLFIEKSCLKCHGKKEDAPQIIRDKYDKSYGYKLGELRGMIHFKISDKATFTELDKAFNKSILTKVFIFIVIVFLLYYLISIIRKNELEYTRKLENKVTEQVTQLREKDNILNNQSKMAAMGEMLENIAHQWRQPLATISLNMANLKLDMDLEEKISQDELKMSIKNVDKQCQYLSNTIDDFRDFFKSNKDKKLFSIQETYKKAIALIDSKFKNNEIILKSQIEDIKVFGVQNELVQVFMNILNNAKDALLNSNIENKLIFVTIEQVNDELIIQIKDNANGVPIDIINKVFEPYFTTKHKSQGTGIGLYMSREIITKQFKGRISIKNSEYQFEGTQYTGAQFDISLPTNQTNI